MQKQVELVSGVICVVIWILLFGAGLMIPSESYRKSLEQSFTLYNFFMAGLLYTYTNVVTLTCLACSEGYVVGLHFAIMKALAPREITKARKWFP